MWTPLQLPAPFGVWPKRRWRSQKTWGLWRGDPTWPLPLLPLTLAVSLPASPHTVSHQHMNPKPLSLCPSVLLGAHSHIHVGAVSCRAAPAPDLRAISCRTVVCPSPWRAQGTQ